MGDDSLHVIIPNTQPVRARFTDGIEVPIIAWAIYQTEDRDGGTFTTGDPIIPTKDDGDLGVASTMDDFEGFVWDEK